MAMFLSRIKKVLNLGTKNITVNGTYNASSDGYDGYSSVEVNVPTVTPTSITPSNASPVALTSGNAVTPSANGYAIESYFSRVPSNTTPGYYNPDDIIRVVNKGGYLVESITSVTPSSTPRSILKNNLVLFKGNGVIVDTITDITPSDSSPASVSSGDIIKASASGYLYSTVQPKVKKGTFTTSGSSITEFAVNVGFQPDTVIVFFNGSSGSETSAANGSVRYVYDKNSSTRGFRSYKSSSGATVDMAAVDTSGDTRISAITSTGFKWRNGAPSIWNGTHTYIAIKW